MMLLSLHTTDYRLRVTFGLVVHPDNRFPGPGAASLGQTYPWGLAIKASDEAASRNVQSSIQALGLM